MHLFQFLDLETDVMGERNFMPSVIFSNGMEKKYRKKINKLGLS
jgi:hypothetical protein